MRGLAFVALVVAVILFAAGHADLAIPIAAITATVGLLDAMFGRHHRRRRRHPVARLVWRALLHGQAQRGAAVPPAPAFSPLGETRARRQIPRVIRQQVYRRDRGRCRACGITDAQSWAATRERLQYDHIVPFSKNGADTVGNIQLLCGPCNRAKSAKMPS